MQIDGAYNMIRHADSGLTLFSSDKMIHVTTPGSTSCHFVSAQLWFSVSVEGRSFI